MINSILPADTFIVINNTILNDNDRKLLVMLYQPIIGYSATMFYLSLWTYLDKSEIISREYTHHHLMSNMNMNLDEILDSRIKLEAIGLLRTYKKNDEYIYELYSPLSAQEFLDSPMLSTVLENNLGESEFQNIVNYFSIPKINKSDYVDISKKFQDVFKIEKINDRDISNLKSRNTLKINIDVDISNIIDLIPDDILNKKIITNDTIDTIKKLMYLYDYSDEEVDKIIRNSINEKKQIDKALLKNNFKRYYQFENNGSLPTIVYKNQPKNLRNTSEKISKKSKMIHQFETLSPFYYLTAKNNGVEPSRSDMAILEYLLTDLSLNPGVVNVLIDYVLRINDNKLTRNYVEVIASQWVRYNVTTVEQAMELANKEFNKKSKKKVSKKEVKEIKPEWFDKDIKQEFATTDELLEMDELLSQFK